MTKQLSRWYGAISDFNYADKEVNSAGGVSKLLMKGSIEQMALDITMNKQKILEQEKELRVLIQYTYGMNVYNEMIELRRKLRKQREDEVYRKRELKRALIEGFLVLLLIVVFKSLTPLSKSCKDAIYVNYYHCCFFLHTQMFTMLWFSVFYNSFASYIVFLYPLLLIMVYYYD